MSYRDARVLVVEDNRVNQKVATRVLASFDIEARLAENGAQAVEMVQNEYFDLVLMDCQMPVMDGYEATKAIRVWESLGAGGSVRRRVPIIAMTANALFGDRDKCLAAGMDDYLSKPIKRDKMVAALARWLNPAGLRPATGSTCRSVPTA